MKVFRWLATALSTVIILNAGFVPAKAAEPEGPDRLIDREYIALIAVRQALESSEKKLSISKRDLKGLKDYYAAEEAKLIWINEGGLDKAALSSLQTAFRRADGFGLDPREYTLPDTLSQPVLNDQSSDWLAETELRVSLAAIEYADHAQAGRVAPTSIDSEFLDLTPVRPAPNAILSSLASGRDNVASALEAYHPTHPQFAALKSKLAETQLAATTGKIPVRIPDGPSLGPDTYHPQVAIVRERLAVPVPADAPRGNPAEYYDEILAEAVRVFQETKGLKPDGVVGQNTREALNEGTIPVSVNTIVSNMERWRWVPREFGERYIFVNVPEFKFRFISDKRIIHEERIVTGSPKHPTPIFVDEMETVVFNPYWNVPKSILVNEIIPAARNSPDYLYKNNLEVIWQGKRTVDPYMVDWTYVNPDKLALRQTPGDANALGRVKFLFPNRHAVYMHDTPSKHLFNRPVRAYSHGCMRVRNPLEFARLLLADQGWSDVRIQRTLQTAHDQHVRLGKKVPIYITYFTAWVDDEGTMHGFRDIYGHDASVRVALKLDSRKMLASSREDFEIGEGGLQN